MERIAAFAVAAFVSCASGCAQYGEMSLRFTNVMVHRDGRWQLFSHQSTRVPTR